MSSDTLSSAIPLLQPHSEASPAHLYTHLSSLLTRYTSGLSLPIAVDTLPSAETRPTYHELRVITTRSSPSLLLLKPVHASAQHHAFFPAQALPPLPPDTVVRLPLAAPSPDALALAQRLFPAHRIAHAHLPTLDVLILLPFPRPLPLPHPHRSYSLQSIWNLRDLTPPAVYATLQSVSDDPARLTLVDGPGSPPVTFRLHPTRHRLLRTVAPPCSLLITAPLVAPADDGFSLHETPASVFFVQSRHPKKRPRKDPPRVFRTHELRDRATRDVGYPITVHARVNNFRKMDSGRGVVDLGEVDVVIPDSSVEKGDEIVLMGVTYGTRWSAHRVENISTMLGMLYCPFIANFINIRKAEALCSGNEFLTAFVKVRVTAVETRDMVRLIVEDCVEDEEESCPGSDVQNGKERGVVCMKDRGFLQIFGTTKKGFLRMERDQVRTAVEAIREVVWRIIVCCGVEDVPVLTACVRAS